MSMSKSFLVRFSTRWFVSSLGLWIAAAILGSSRLSVGHSIWTVIGAGLFVALVNMGIKPLLILLSLPAVILSLGLFLLVINGLSILIASWVYSPLYVRDLWVAIITGVILGFVNYLVTKVSEDIK